MEVCLLVILIISGVFADSIKPNDKDTNMIKTEGESVTLSCTYDTSSNYIYLYWYRQYPNKEPQYLLRKGARTYSGIDDIPDSRFQSATSQTSTELTINSVTLSDSALYYCALRVAPTWGDYAATDPLTFGKPITLTVTPKDVAPTPPFLSVLSPIKNDGPDICLAAGFFPQEKKMTLTLEDNKEEDLKTSDAPFSSSAGKYYYAGFSGNSKIKTCEMDEEKANKTDTTEPTDQPKPSSPQPCETSTTKTSASEFIDTGVPKMNFMNLLVTGLRILLAKCVAVNVMMTVKAFVF